MTVTVLAAILAFAVIRVSMRTGIVIMLASFLILPTGLVVPGLFGLFPLSRVVIFAYLAGIIWRVRRGELPLSCLRPRRLHLVLAIFLTITFFNGLILNQVGNGLRDASVSWLMLVDHLAVLVATLATARVLGGWRVLRTLVLLLFIAAIVGVLERLLHTSSAAWFYKLLGVTGRRRTRGLAIRGDVRVRVGFAYALEFAWVLAIAFPAVVVWATRTRKRLRGPVVLAAVVFALLFTVSRSAPAGVALGLVVLVVATRDRRVIKLCLVGLAGAGLLLLAQPSLLSSYDEANADSFSTRARRTYILTTEVADRPYQGFGFAHTQEFGFNGTDSSVLQVYTSTGVPGLIGYGLMLLGAICTALAGLWVRKRAMFAAAALASMLAAVVGDLSTNIFFVSGVSKTFWVIAALGAWASDPLVVNRERRKVNARVRAVFPVAGVVLGLLVAVIVPSRASAVYQVSVLTIADELTIRRSPGYIENHIKATSCEIVHRIDLPHASLECFDLRELDDLLLFRVDASSLQAALDAGPKIQAVLTDALPDVRIKLVRSATGRPTFAAHGARLARQRRPGGCPAHSAPPSSRPARRRGRRPALTPPRSSVTTAHVLSVVVPTRDRPEMLAACLEALRASLRHDDELIVVDSASSDAAGVAAVAATAGARVVRCDAPGASKARNAGVTASSHDIVAFVDDDVRVAPPWAESMAEAFADHSVAFVTGRVEAPHGQTERQRLVAIKDETVATRLDRDTPSPLGASANLGVRKEVLSQLGGFDESLGGGAPLEAAEDLDLFDRLLAAGFTGYYEPGALAWHEQWREGWALVRLDWRYGIGSGARLAKLARSDRARLRRVLREVFWVDGLSVIGRSLRAGERLALATTIARLFATFIGFVRGAVRRTVDGHYAGRRW